MLLVQGTMLAEFFADQLTRGEVGPKSSKLLSYIQFIFDLKTDHVLLSNHFTQEYIMQDCLFVFVIMIFYY